MNSNRNLRYPSPSEQESPDPGVTLFAGDSLSILRTFPAGSIDAVVTDPPYAIRANRQMRAAASREPSSPDSGMEATPSTTACADRSSLGDSHDAGECADCLLDLEIEAFAEAGMLGQQSANWHESATHSRGYADNDPALFQRWCFLWASECLRVLKPGGHMVAFGGTRTWHRLACAVEEAGFEIRDSLAWLYATGFPKSVDVATAVQTVAGTGPAGLRATNAADWAGWGTALKPAHEPVVLARKPLVGTVGRNVAAFGTGGLNIDGCRVRPVPVEPLDAESGDKEARWPSNVFLDAGQGDVLDEQAHPKQVSRFFWVAKPSKTERVRVDGVSHPTVKPVDLMRELVRLVTPPGGIVLDPFAGSGTTVEACVLEGFNCVAIERDKSYLPLIEARLIRANGDEVCSTATSPLTAEPSLLTLF